MRIQVTAQVLDPWQEVSRYQSEQTGLRGKFGATSVFVGTLRDFNQGATVRAMTLEHYAPMTEKYLERVAREALGRWPLEDVLVIHRYGELQLNEPIVLVAVWAAHRDNAFSACRYVIDELKTRAPFWKKELTEKGTRWVGQEKSPSG